MHERAMPGGLCGQALNLVTGLALVASEDRDHLDLD